MLDRYLQGIVSRVSPEAPVPIVCVDKTDLKVGGAGNVALNIVALGSKARVLSAIGADDEGDTLSAHLQKQGVETTFLFREKERKTSIKTRVVAQNQQLLRYDEETVVPVNEKFCQYIRQNSADIFQGIQGIILSDYGKGVLTPQVTQLIIQKASDCNIPVFIDPKGADYSKYSGADYCTPNLKELREASGKKTLKDEEEIFDAALSLCHQCGIRNLLVTRSEKGMSLISMERNQKWDYPAVAKEVSDVTGAGDTVISVFTLAMVAGYPVDQCCTIANLAASIVVSKFGAATATLEEIGKLIRAQGIHTGKKRLTSQEAGKLAESLRRDGRKIVFTNGCFDLVHAGHISSFAQAKALGDVLFLGLNSDDSIRKLKGNTRPIVTLEHRMKLLEAIETIDYIVPFEEETPQSLIEVIRPDVLVKGKDWEGKPVAGSQFLQSYGGRVEFIDLEQGLSTTAIINKILLSNRE